MEPNSSVITHYNGESTFEIKYAVHFKKKKIKQKINKNAYVRTEFGLDPI